MISKRHIFLGLLALSLLGCGTCAVAQSPQLAPGDVIAKFDYQPHPTRQGIGELTLDLRDAVTQQPLEYTSRRLAAWLQKSPKTLSDGEVGCSDKVRALASQGVGRRAVVDFNTYSLVTVNTDRTVAFVNPFLRMNNAKLEGVVTLPGDATAILHHTKAREIWIAMRQSDAIAVIDSDTRALKKTINFAAGSAPLSMALKGASVWVSFAGREQWLRFDDSQSAGAAASVNAKASAGLYFNPTAGALMGLGKDEILLMDGAANSITHQPLDANPVTAAWSELARLWVVATDNSDLLLVDPLGRSGPKKIKLRAQATQLLLTDGGRYLFASTPSIGSVSIVDIASAKVLQTVAVVDGVDELAQSASYVYANSAGTGQATLLALPDSRIGAVKPVNISVGSPGKVRESLAQAGKLLANTTDNLGMLIASPQDGQIYQYAEGMMAPIGGFSNYKRSPVAMLVLNHGFEFLGNGQYRTTLRHTAGGPHELVLSGVQPRFASCNPLVLPEVLDAKKEALTAQPLARLLEVKNGDSEGALVISVGLENQTSHLPLVAVHDLVLLAFDKRNGWQRRVPLVEKSPGQYIAALSTLGASRTFDLLVSSATQDMPFGSGFIGSYVVQAP